MSSRSRRRRRDATRSAARLLAVAVALALAALVATACTQQPRRDTGLTVLAGSELKDLEPLLPRIEQATGVRLRFEYTGTLDGAQRILGGDPAKLAWFSSNRYLTLAAGSSGTVLSSTSIMLSPVVLGVQESVADRFGWSDNPDVTWRDIAERAAAGEFRYAMTNPAASNSGFSALVGVASAFAGTGNALTSDDVRSAQLRRFFEGQTLTAGSSGFLAESYVRDEADLDGIINYESILLELNSSGDLTEPLTLVYPRDGIVTADYPFMLLDDSVRKQYDRVVDYLKTPDVQRWLMTHTDRRPVVPDVPLDSRFPSSVLVELPFPSSLGVLNDLISAYLNEIRAPSFAVFVLDVSGSMKGDRIAALKRAMAGLTGLDRSITGVFARFRDREQITIETFGEVVYDVQGFTIDGTDPTGPSMTAIRAYVNGLQASGGTAIYSALERAYEEAVAAKQADPELFTSVVLLTDGENNEGVGPAAFLQFLRALPPEAASVKTFAVLFGEADPGALHQIADVTGGAVFDSRTAPLSEVFKEIRGYQ